MASERARAIWEQSVPIAAFLLNEAQDRITATPLVANELGWQLLEVFYRTYAALAQPGRVIQRTKNAVRRGTLIASGFRHASSRSRSPVLISGAAFASGRLQLFQEAIVGAEISYSDIRLIPKTMIPAKWASARPRQAARQAANFKVIRELEKAGKLGGLRKQQIPTVREALDQSSVRNIGTDKTIERLIRIALNLAGPKK